MKKWSFCLHDFILHHCILVLSGMTRVFRLVVPGNILLLGYNYMLDMDPHLFELIY